MAFSNSRSPREYEFATDTLAGGLPEKAWAESLANDGGDEGCLFVRQTKIQYPFVDLAMENVEW